MTPEHLHDCLGLLRWSQRGLAEILQTHPTTVRRWAAGTQAVPENVAVWLDGLATHAALHPLPAGWRREAA